jgi:hypothetical protein
MSIEEFLKELKEVAPQFRWSKGTFIRAYLPWYKFLPKDFCPITAIAYTRYKSYPEIDQMYVVGRKIGLCDIDIRKILIAADMRHEFDKELRNKIREAVKL